MNKNSAFETIQAYPTKNFFIKTLTRDILLEDSILDLLDNCIDGIIRHKLFDTEDKSKPYKGKWAKITIKENYFSISDNCGGIEKDLAIKSAFLFGKSSDHEFNGDQTIGMYGIGMKRAIFKIGNTAKVTSQTNEDSYIVKIDNEWMGSKEWTLKLIQHTPKLNEPGTLIEISDLTEHTAHEFEVRPSTA